MLQSLGKNFVEKGFSVLSVTGTGTPVAPLVRACTFAHRMPHVIDMDAGCFLAVSPYMFVLYANALAATFAALYIGGLSTTAATEPEKKANGGAVSKWIDKALAAVHGVMQWPWTMAVLATLNFIFCTAGMAVALTQGGASGGAFAVLLTFILIGWASVLGLTYLMEQSKPTSEVAELMPPSVTPSGSTTPSGIITLQGFDKSSWAGVGADSSAGGKIAAMTSKAREKLHTMYTASADNIAVVQRMAFWLQYALTLPGLVMLHDQVQQQRDGVLLQYRVLYSIGIVLLAAAHDCLHMFSDKVNGMLQQQPSTGSSSNSNADKLRTDDNLRSSLQWTWGVWFAAAVMMMWPPQAVSMPVHLTDLMPGSHSLVPAALAVYVIAVPIVCMPQHGSTRHMSSFGDGGSKDKTALSMLLVVDLVARVLVTLTVYFWL